MFSAKSLIAGLLLAAGLVACQEEALGPNGQPRPEPYSFSYSADASGSVSSHQESGDGSGRITGVYTIAGPDGRERRVEYVADADGYRATIKTNEIGTKPADSADARWQVQEPSEAQLNAANNANAKSQVLSSANIRPQQTHSSQPNQQPEGSEGSARQIQQQEQIPASANQSPAIAAADETQQQQQTLVNLDDIADQPPTPIIQAPQFQQQLPIQQQQLPIQQQQLPIQEQQLLQQAPLQQPQQQILQGPLPELTFQARPPAQIELLGEPGPLPGPVQQQVRVQEQQVLTNVQPTGIQGGVKQAEVSTLAGPQQANIQAIKSQQQQIELGPLPVAPLAGPQPAQQLINGNQNQREQVSQNFETKFGPRVPVQPVIQAPIPEQPIQIIEQFPPQQQQQLIRVDQPSQAPIQLPPAQFQPIPVPEQPLLVAPAPQPVRVIEEQQQQQQAAKGGNSPVVKGQVEQQVTRIQEQQVIPQQPQQIPNIEQTPAFVPQQPIIQFQAEPQPQLIQVPLEPEIPVPVFQSERIRPASPQQPQLIQAQPQPIQQQQQVTGLRQQQVLLPQEPLRIQPIFSQLAVKGAEQQGLAPAPLPALAPSPLPAPQAPASKGQLEIVSLKAEAPTSQGVQENSNDNSSENQDEEDSDAEQKAPAAGPNSAGQVTTTTSTVNAAPITTTFAPITTTVSGQQLPAGRLVFGTKGAARLGTKTGTKSSPLPPSQPQLIVAAPLPLPAPVQTPVAAPAPVSIPAPVAAPAPIPPQMAPQIPNRVAVLAAPQLSPQTTPNQRFIPFGSRLGTKSSLGVKSSSS